MITSVDDWVSFLQDIHLAGGFPLIVAGLVLMLFGWRLWRVCVVLTFAVIGAVVAARVAGPGPDEWFYALTGAVVLGITSYFPAKHSIVVLGGILATGAVYYLLADRNLSAPVLYGSLALTLFAGTAYSAINRQRIVVFVTAFLGAVLLVSGAASWLSAFPGLSGMYKSLAASSAFVIPFAIFVPGVVSTFYQFAEVRRLRADL